MTKVIFRKYKSDGDIIAIFPEIIADNRNARLSYQHIGQHGACDIHLMQAHTIPAKEHEYRELLQELKRVGYDDLVVKMRLSYK